MVSIDEVIDCLNKKRIRATYSAVGMVIGCDAKEVPGHLQAWNQKRGLKLDHRDPETSWVVRVSTGKPAGYTADDEHPELYRTTQIITTRSELDELLRLCAPGGS